MCAWNIWYEERKRGKVKKSSNLVGWMISLCLSNELSNTLTNIQIHDTVDEYQWQKKYRFDGKVSRYVDLVFDWAAKWSISLSVIFVFNMKLMHAVVLIVFLHFFIDIGQVGECLKRVLLFLYHFWNEYFSIAEDAAKLANSDNEIRHKKPKKVRTAREKCMKYDFITPFKI